MPATGHPVAAGNPVSDRNLAVCFAEQVAMHGDLAAVLDHDGPMRYRELDCAANRVAHAVLAHTHDTDAAPVAILVEPGRWHAAAMLGVLKSGRPCLPLSLRSPAPHVSAILASSGAELLICDANHSDRAHELAAGSVALLRVDGLYGRHPDDDPGVDVSPDSPACVLYTSGSSGAPKGVVMNHRTIVHAVDDAMRTLELAPGERTAIFLSTAHGLSTTLLFQTLLSGGQLLPFDLRNNGLRALADWLNHQRIQSLKMTTSFGKRLIATLAPGESLGHLRHLWLGGEPLFRDDVMSCWPHVAEDCLVVHGYSATETKNVCRMLLRRGTALDTGVVPVGYPVSGKRIRLLDAAGQEVKQGEVGEIWVQSRYLADGYWCDPALTRTRFLEAPGAPGERRYRTGDLARQRPDGAYVLCGRGDAQVKIRGFRAQPEEIESALRRVPGVRDAAVVAESAGSETRLVAFVAADLGSDDTRQIRLRLAELVPEYLIPARFMILDGLPLSASGKVDRAALSEMHAGRHTPPDILRPAFTNAERVIQATRLIVEHTLGLPQISEDDDLFELGANSLNALQLVEILNTSFGAHLTPAMLYRYRTVSALSARLLDASESASGWRWLTLVQGGTLGPPIYCIHGNLAAVARRLAGRVVYGLWPQGYQRERAATTMGQMANSYLDEIRSAQPGGPRVLGGNSAGGVIAWHMAERLLAQGGQVPFLFMFDSRPPRPRPELVDDRARRTACEAYLDAGMPVPAHLTYFHWRHACTLALRSRPVPTLTCDVLYFKSIETPDSDLDFWRSRTRGRFHCVAVNATHMSLLDEQHAETVSTALARACDAALAAREDLGL